MDNKVGGKLNSEDQQRKSNWWPSTRGVSQGSITGSVPVSSFVKRFNEIACTLNKLAEDTKLGEAADTVEYKAATQGSLNELEKWTNRKVLKITVCKCKALQQGSKNPM